MSGVPADPGAPRYPLAARALRGAVPVAARPGRGNAAQASAVPQVVAARAPRNWALYVFLIDPAVPGADYSLGPILAEVYSDPNQLSEIWALYTGSVTSGGTLLNFSPIEMKAPAPILAPPVNPPAAGQAPGAAAPPVTPPSTAPDAAARPVTPTASPRC